MTSAGLKGLVAILVCAVCSCSPAGDPAHPPPVKVYRHAMDGAPSSLDPAHASSIYARFVVVNVYDTLYRYKYLARPYQLEPNLAAAMPEVSTDGLTYTFRLKPGVMFVDDPAFEGGSGREVTAEDVIYSLKRHFDPSVRSQGAWLWRGKIRGMDEWQAGGAHYEQPVPGLTAPDRHTLVVELVRPFPQFTHTLALGESAIVPREAVEFYGREFGVHPVGSGPFQLLSFDVTKAVLEANRGFRQEPVDLAAEGYTQEHSQADIQAIGGRAPPFVDRVELHFITDDTARWVSFQKGNEIQFTKISQDQQDQVLESLSPPVLKSQYRQRYRLYAGIEAGFARVALNMADPAIGRSPDPATDARNRALRCAIRKAFDWDLRNRVFYGGNGEIFPGIIPPVVPEFDPTLTRDSLVHDPEGARRLLSEAGWTPDNLPELEFAIPSGVRQQQGYEQLRSQLAAVGFPAEKFRRRVYPTFGELIRAARSGEVQMFLPSWSLDYPDAENVLQLFYGPNASPGSNSGNYANPDYDRLYEEAAVMLPSPARTALYRRMNQIVIDDCATISGISRRRLYLLHENVMAIPDRDTLGGFFIRFVDLRQ